jgi:hypothetical protein
MLEAILIWTGAVLGISVVLLMALGPVIVEVDSWFYERKLARRARKAAKARAAAQPARELARV